LQNVLLSYQGAPDFLGPQVYTYIASVQKKKMLLPLTLELVLVRILMGLMHTLVCVVEGKDWANSRTGNKEICAAEKLVSVSLLFK